MEPEDLKCLLGQFGQWYLVASQTIKEILEKEKTKNVFENDKFETGYKDAGGFLSESQEQLAENVEFDTGGMRPDSALLREFGLPVPIDFDNLGARGSRLDSHRRGTSSIVSSRGYREEQQA